MSGEAWTEGTDDDPEEIASWNEAADEFMALLMAFTRDDLEGMNAYKDQRNDLVDGALVVAGAMLMDLAEAAEMDQHEYLQQWQYGRFEKKDDE